MWRTHTPSVEVPTALACAGLRGVQKRRRGYVSVNPVACLTADR